jgi:hypothetical protein
MAREPLALVKPPKPISEMTDAERKAYADKLFEQIAPPRDLAVKDTS